MKCAYEGCGVEFVAKRKTAKFCSDACRIKNHRPSLRTVGRKLYDENVEMRKYIATEADFVYNIARTIALEPNRAKRLRLLAQLVPGSQTLTSGLPSSNAGQSTAGRG